ncbi:UDP-sugar hydrolase [Minicystis rosea]|nr:UDP-sugar hydrolase [Minicystis rosea]
MNLRVAGAFALALALAACNEATPPLAAAPRAPETPAPRCLSIVGWNDLHGQLDALDTLIDTGRVPAGGVIALADQIASIRATGDAVVLLDAGDEFTGPMPSTMAEGAPVIEAYKLLGVDAAAIGNHDFDFGPVGYDKVTAAAGVGDEAGAEGPRGALLARMADAPYPFLSANVHKKGGGPTGWPKHKAWTMIDRGGFKIGVVGYTTQDTPSTTLKPNVADLEFAQGAAARVAQAIREARAQGAAIVVLLAHASLEGDLPASIDDDHAHHGELARITGELGADKPDVIVGGHRHAWMLGRVNGIPIVSSDWHGVGLSRIRYCTGPAGAPVLEGIERRTTMAVTPPMSALGAEVRAAMAPWQQKVKAIADAPLGSLPRICEPKAPNGTAFADQVARAQVENIATVPSPPPAGVPIVGLTNIGSLRASIGPGRIRYEDAFSVCPFENTVAACATTRAGLVRFIENALRKDSARERFPLGVSGARLKVKRAPDRTLSFVSVEIDGQPRDMKDDAPVWLAISDFMLHGGDDLLDGVTCKPGTQSQTRIRDAWRRVIERDKTCDGPSKSVIVE